MINKITGPLDYLDLKEREREKKRLKKLDKIKRLFEEFLKETPEIEKLYLIGSLVREGAFYDFSDIDLEIKKEEITKIKEKILMTEPKDPFLGAFLALNLHHL